MLDGIHHYGHDFVWSPVLDFVYMFGPEWLTQLSGTCLQGQTWKISCCWPVFSVCVTMVLFSKLLSQDAVVTILIQQFTMCLHYAFMQCIENKAQHCNLLKRSATDSWWNSAAVVSCMRVPQSVLIIEKWCAVSITVWLLAILSQVHDNLTTSNAGARDLSLLDAAHTSGCLLTDVAWSMGTYGFCRTWRQERSMIIKVSSQDGGKSVMHTAERHLKRHC